VADGDGNEFHVRKRKHIHHNPKRNTSQVVAVFRKTKSNVKEKPLKPKWKKAPLKGDGDGSASYSEHSCSDGGTEYRSVFHIHHVNATPDISDTKTFDEQSLIIKHRSHTVPKGFCGSPNPTKHSMPYITQSIVSDMYAPDGLIPTLKIHDPVRWARDPDVVLRECLERHLWGESAKNRAEIKAANDYYAKFKKRHKTLKTKVAKNITDIANITTKELPTLSKNLTTLQTQLNNDLHTVDTNLRSAFGTVLGGIDTRIKDLEALAPRLYTNDRAVQYQIQNLRTHINNLHRIIYALAMSITPLPKSPILGIIPFDAMPFDDTHTEYKADPAKPLDGERNRSALKSTMLWNQLVDFYKAPNILPPPGPNITIP
jgi:hypothetical protein